MKDPPTTASVISGKFFSNPLFTSPSVFVLVFIFLVVNGKG